MGQRRLPTNRDCWWLVTKYRVYMSTSISQVIEIDADSAYEAAELAQDKVDKPNISNGFEQDGEWHPLSIENIDTNTFLWDSTNEDDYPPAEHESEW